MPLSAEWLPQIITRYCGCASPWGVQEEKRHTGTSYGELKGASVFVSGLELPNGLGETAHNHSARLFLIKEHTQHISVQVLPPQPSSPMAWKFHSLSWELAPRLWCPENGTAQALQTFHQGWGAFPLSVSRIHFMAPRENKMTPLVPSESRDFLPIQILMMC